MGYFQDGTALSPLTSSAQARTQPAQDNAKNDDTLSHVSSGIDLPLSGLSQQDVFKQIGTMLQSALHSTSENISDCLSQDLGARAENSQHHLTPLAVALWPIQHHTAAYLQAIYSQDKGHPSLDLHLTPPLNWLLYEDSYIQQVSLVCSSIQVAFLQGHCFQ